MKDKPTELFMSMTTMHLFIFFAHGCFSLIYLEQSNVDYDGQIHEVKGSWEENMFLVYNIVVRYIMCLLLRCRISYVIHPCSLPKVS